MAERKFRSPDAVPLQGERIRCLGHCMGYFEDRAVIALPLVGGGAIGIPSDLKGLKLGDEAEIEVQVTGTADDRIVVSGGNAREGFTPADLDRFKVRILEP